MATESTGRAIDKCRSCGKSKSELDLEAVNLKRCGRCQKASYCSKECQSSDWQAHKLSCVKPRPAPDARSSLPFTHHMAVRATGQEPATYFQRLYDRTNSEAEVYKHLIDVYRLRVQDDIDFIGHMHGAHTEDPAGPLPDFQEFMTLAEERGLLPNWWNAEKRQACEAVAMGGEDNDIRSIIGKQEVQEVYGAPFMPMVFRTIADRVYGKCVMAELTTA